MSNGIDEELGRLLRADAPPERDALFRIQVLERRERHRYRRLAMKRLVVTAALITLPAVLLVDEPIKAALFVLFGLALSAALVVSFQGLRQALRWTRQSRG